MVIEMPTEETLRELYDGFIPHLDANTRARIRELAGLLFPQLPLPRRRPLRMLDIGGGGGFFCRAFEDLDYGEGTYVDLDPQSCAFARNELGLTRTFNCRAESLSSHGDVRFDFIYARHLIEHLTEPTDFLEKTVDLLTDDGIFVVQCPNGDSLEYLGYPHQNIRHRIRNISRSSGFSRLKTLRILLTGGILHGMDPPRHLWAVSEKGMTTWARRKSIPCESFARHLGDFPFSPGYSPQQKIVGRAGDWFAQRVLAPIRGGTHLVAILSRPAP